MKTAQEYLSLPYTMTVRRDDRDSIYVARVKEISACTGHGDSPAAALEMLNDNLEDWIVDAIEQGDPIPLPENLSELPSGKWVQRVPRSLHQRLTETAEQEGVSLNQLVVSYLSEAIGKRDQVQERADAGILPDVLAGYVLPDLTSRFGYEPSATPTIAGAEDDFFNTILAACSKSSQLGSHLVIKKPREEDSYGYKKADTLCH